MPEIVYDRGNCTGTVDGNTNATFSESVKKLKKLIKSEKNISGDITIEKIWISEKSNGNFKISVEYDLDGELMKIDLPFEKCEDLSVWKNSRETLDKINGETQRR